MCYHALQVVGENVGASGAVKEILGAAAEKAAQAKATKVLLRHPQFKFCCSLHHRAKQERPPHAGLSSPAKSTMERQSLNLIRGCSMTCLQPLCRMRSSRQSQASGTFPRTMRRP